MQPSDRKPYFAMDPGDEVTLTGEIVQAIDDAQQQEPGTAVLMALVDGSFDVVGGKPVPTHPYAQPLYSEGRWAALREAGPWLVPLPGSIEEGLERELRRLVRHCRGKPMFSVLFSRLDLLETAQHLRRFIAPEVEGMDATLLRFADARVSAALPKALSTQLWNQFTAPLRHWWIVGRDGRLLELPHSSAAGTNDVSDLDRFRLSDAELDQLVEAGLPDALINTMEEQLPEFLPDTDRAAFHSLMRRVVELAKDFAVDSYPDQYALAVLAATHGQAVLASSELAEVLSGQGWPSGRLAKRLLEMT